MADIAADLIYYMADGKLNDGEEEKLLQRYRDEFPDHAKPDKLPPKIA